MVMVLQLLVLKVDDWRLSCLIVLFKRDQELWQLHDFSYLLFKLLGVDVVRYLVVLITLVARVLDEAVDV